MKNFAHLRKDSPFYPLFRNGMAPVKNIALPSVVRLQGENDPQESVEEAYMLDWSKCTSEQRITIAETVTQLRGGKAGEFLDYMERGGDMPIRASQTTGCSTDAPFFL